MADVDKTIGVQHARWLGASGPSPTHIGRWRLGRRPPVADFIKRQEVRQRRRKPQKTSFVALGPRMKSQMDVAKMVQVNREPTGREETAAHDPGFKFALVAVDVFSKAISVVPLANTRQGSTTKALDTVIDTLGPCNFIMTDRGREFEGPVMSG